MKSVLLFCLICIAISQVEGIQKGKKIAHKTGRNLLSHDGPPDVYNDSCEYALDEYCDVDDGSCEVGTDCTDCGDCGPAPPPPPPPPPPPSCTSHSGCVEKKDGNDWYCDGEFCDVCENCCLYGDAAGGVCPERCNCPPPPNITTPDVITTPPTCGDLKTVYQVDGGCCGNAPETLPFKNPCRPPTEWNNEAKQCVFDYRKLRTCGVSGSIADCLSPGGTDPRVAYACFKQSTYDAIICQGDKLRPCWTENKKIGSFSPYYWTQCHVAWPKLDMRLCWDARGDPINVTAAYETGFCSAAGVKGGHTADTEDVEVAMNHSNNYYEFKAYLDKLDAEADGGIGT